MTRFERPSAHRLCGLRVAALLLALCVAAPAARSDVPDTRFNDRVAEALALEEAGDADGALDALNGALAAIRDETDASYANARVRVLYRQAALLRTLGKLEQSRAVLEVVQRSPGLDPGDREVVLEKLRALDAEIVAATAAQAPGTVLLTAVGADGASLKAEVSLDGRIVGTTPIQLSETPGRYALVVRADGHEPLLTELHVVAGTNTEQQLRLAPRPTSSLRLAAWSTLAVGLAAGIAGGVVHGLSIQDRSFADNGLSYTEAADAARRSETELDAALGLYVTMAAAGVTSLVLFLLDGGDSPSDAVAWRVWPAPIEGGGLLSGALSFR